MKKHLKKEGMSLTEKTIKSSFWNFLATFVSRLGGLIFTIVLARFMMPRLFGIYNITASLALIFLTLADLGVNSALIKYVSEEVNKNNKKKAAAYSRYLFKFKLVAILIIAIILILIAYPVSFFVFKKPLLMIPLIISSFYIIVLSIEGFLQAFFYAIQKVYYLSIKEILTQTSRIILVLIAFLVLPAVYFVSASFVVLTITYIAMAFFLLFYLRKVLPGIFSKSPIKINKKRVFRFIFWLSIANISAVFFSYIDVLMIGALIKDASFAGFYRAAFTLVSGISGLFVLASVLLPALTQVRKNHLRSAFNNILKYLFMLSVPIAFGAAVLSKFIIKVVYGYEYLPAALPFFFVSFLIIELVVEGLLLSFFSSQEKPKIYAKVVIFSTFLNVILNYIFITTLLKVSDTWAIAGAGIATLISRYVHLFILFYYIQKDFKIKTDLRNIIKPFVSAAIMFFSLYFILKQISDMNLIKGILLVLFGGIVYLFCLWTFKGLKKRDFEVFRVFFN